MLLRALANLVLDYVPGEGAWFTTMERGHYGVHADSEEELAAWSSSAWFRSRARGS